MAPSVLWFRRDLRIADNPALCAAAESAGAEGVVGTFILDDRLRSVSGPNRLAFLYRSLRELNASMGGTLVLRSGPPGVAVRDLARQVGAVEVFAAADFGPYGRQRDLEASRVLAADGRWLTIVGSPYAVAPGITRKADGSPFRVFSPFFKAWRSTGWGAPTAIPVGLDWRGAPSAGVPHDPPTDAALPPAGEPAALARLREFRAGQLATYGEVRDVPGADATSHLSVYLKWGTLHPRQVLEGLGTGSAADRLRRELAWREFYADVLWHRPESAREALLPAMTAMEVDEGEHADVRFAAWAEGRTGYPIVDAGMRQLRREGWMHNRVRMITASFLVKDLHLDWRRGARFFMHELVDGDLASNQHGWQWVAGTGTDPAPYFRVFNPVLQGEKFDPEGAYVRRFVPVLTALPAAVIHHPWDAPGGPPAGYPSPVIDHATERREALTRCDAVRAGGRQSPPGATDPVSSRYP